MKNLKEEVVDTDEKLNIVDERGEKDKTSEDLKKDYPDNIESLEEASLVYIGEKDPITLKTEYPDTNWKHLTKKVSYIFEQFNSIDDYQKPVSALKKEDF